MYQIKRFIEKTVGAFILCFLTTYLWAQDGIEVKIGKTESAWYTRPWVWIVGGAVFILLLVALLRGGNKK